MSSNPSLVPALQVLLSAVIGFSMVYIAYQQWKTNDRKLKADMYERRVRIYREVVAFFTRVIADLKPTVPETSRFRGDTAEVAFLFEPEVDQFIQQACVHAIGLHSANLQYRGIGQDIPPGYDHNRVITEIQTHSEWMEENRGKVEELFRPYLRVK